MIIDPKFVLLMIVPYLLGANLPQPENQQLSLSIGVPEQTVKIGSEIKLKTTLTNVTNHVITFSDTNRDCDYLAEVRDDRGDPAPETGYKRQLRCTGRLADARNISVSLKPQESREDEIILTRLYDLNRPGKYLVQVLRKLPKELGGGIVKSNTITITVFE